MAGKFRPYSEEDMQTMRDMRAEGKSFAEIADRIGRPKESLTAKWQTMQAKNASKKPARKYVKTQDSPSASAPTNHKPMIALIGTPDEVKNTLKELFS